MDEACSMTEMKMHTFQSVHLKGKKHLGDLGIDGRIILQWIKKETECMWTEFIWLRTGFNVKLL
jgi:hypothetical protein